VFGEKRKENNKQQEENHYEHIPGPPAFKQRHLVVFPG